MKLKEQSVDALDARGAIDCNSIDCILVLWNYECGQWCSDNKNF